MGIKIMANHGFRNMELLMAYHRSHSVKVRNQIVQFNAGLVRNVAYKIGQQCCEPLEDLEQMGYLGLIRAIERYDPHHGCAFSSFALPYIRGEMLHYLRDKSSIMRIPRRWHELYGKSKKVAKKLTSTLGREPKDFEIAEALNISLKEWHECQLALQNRQLVSLDATLTNLDSPVSFGDTLPDPHSENLQNLVEERLQLQGAMNQLEDKTKAAIECVFLRDLPRKEAAKKIGISPMTVTRHLQKGLEQLGAILQPQVA